MPAALNVREALAPCARSSTLAGAPPPLKVTVWFVASAFFQVTLVPALTVSARGAKSKFLTRTEAAADAAGLAGRAIDVEPVAAAGSASGLGVDAPPHPEAANTAAAVARTVIERMGGTARRPVGRISANDASDARPSRLRGRRDGEPQGMRALCLNCTLKRSPEPSNTESLAAVVLDRLRAEGVEVDDVRVVDHQVEPGVVSEAVTDGDEWPALRERILAAEILVIATPTWLGQPSSIAKRVLERMDAMLSETAADDATPVAYNRVAGVVVTGNEDGAHHVIAEIAGALIDIGYTVPAQAWTYWNKGPGPGDEEWSNTDEREWSITTGHTAAQNLLAAARALSERPLPPPADS